MNRFPIAGLVLAGLMFLLSPCVSFAGITLSATRVVLAAPKKEASIQVTNRASADVMIQSWIEPDAANADVPFAITPALSRLAKDKQQTLRILYYGQGLPADRESVFWLNVQEIPQKAPGSNTLQLAVRQRIKLFFRPAGLPGKVEDAPAQLRWRLVSRDGKAQLEVSNPTVFYVSLASASVQSHGRNHAVETEMLPPLTTRRFDVRDLPASAAAADAAVHFESINDYGAIEPHDDTTAAH